MTQDPGASVPDQALVSDQAAARLDPSGFDPSRDEPTIHASREGVVELASWNSGRIVGGPWNWLQLRFRDNRGIVHLQDYTPLERERKIVAWANRSVASVQEHMWRGEDLLRQTLAAIDTGRSEPLFIMRDAIRSFLDRDSDEHPEGEDPKGLSGEAMPARAEGIAQTPPAILSGKEQA